MTVPSTPAAAVAVLNNNGRHLLDDCLDNLARLSLPAEIIVVDNGSTDDSVAHLRRRHPGVRTIALGQNLGFAGGYNAALAQVDRPWIALVNNDASLAPDWLERLLDWAARFPRAAILGGKLRFRGLALTDGARLIQAAGCRLTAAGTGFEIGWGESDRGQHDQPGLVGAVPGAALLVRRDAWQALGGFAAGYFIYLEDVDLCWRAWLLGYEVHYVPAAVADHDYGGWSGARISPFRIRWMQRNRLANMARNLQARTWPRALAVSAIYDAYRVLEYSRRRRWDALRALLAGSQAFWRDRTSILAQRKEVQRTRRRDDRELRRLGLMVSAQHAFREYRRLGTVTLPGGAGTGPSAGA